MRIAIVGTGNVGASLARGLKGHCDAVTLGTRSPEDQSIRTLADEVGASVALPALAAEQSDVVILALPWEAAEDAVRQLGELADKIVVDCMNPLGMVDGVLGLTIGHSSSGGERLQNWLPKARVVKTLNQVGAEIMAANASFPQRPVMFMAGNDGAAKLIVAELLKRIGFSPYDAGDITRSRLLEPLAMVWINQAIIQGKGRNWAFSVVEG